MRICRSGGSLVFESEDDQERRYLDYFYKGARRVTLDAAHAERLQKVYEHVDSGVRFEKCHLGSISNLDNKEPITGANGDT